MVEFIVLRNLWCGGECWEAVGRVSWVRSRFVGYSGLSIFGNGQESMVRGKLILQKEKEEGIG